MPFGSLLKKKQQKTVYLHFVLKLSLHYLLHYFKFTCNDLKDLPNIVLTYRGAAIACRLPPQRPLPVAFLHSSETSCCDVGNSMYHIEQAYPSSTIVMTLWAQAYGKYSVLELSRTQYRICFFCAGDRFRRNRTASEKPSSESFAPANLSSSDPVFPG